MPDKTFKMFNPKGRDLGSSMMSGSATTNVGMTGDDDPDAMGGKMPSDQAGYMELEGAVKDGDCSKVEVEGGVSGDKGCSDLFEPIEGAEVFSCATCTYYSSGQADGEQDQPSSPAGAQDQTPDMSNANDQQA